MKKILFLIVIVICCFVHAAYGVFLTFDSDRLLWSDHMDYGTPIVVDCGTSLGLTNPKEEIVSYDFMFQADADDFIYDVNTVESYPEYRGFLFIRVSGPSLFISGIHHGPGSPVWGIEMYGGSPVNVFSREYNSQANYVSIGYFTVNDCIPEPTTISLLSLGMLGILRIKR